jgi:integrase
MIATTLKGWLSRYTLYRTLAPETVAWYGRVVSVYCTWAGGDVLLQDFNGQRISELLRDKEQAGRSLHYVKSLRGGLVALQRDIRGDEPIERVRSVRTPQLDPNGLTPAEVERLLNAVDELPPASRWRYRLMILLGYYTGLDACDIWRIERKHIDSKGGIYFRRRKTGSLVYVRIPPEVVSLIDKHCERNGPMIRMGVSKEWFRRVIGGLFLRAKLNGTFKTLRKSSGSLVERDSPGNGHKHLANSSAIFEKHYKVRRLMKMKPTMPPKIRWFPDS